MQFVIYLLEGNDSRKLALGATHLKQSAYVSIRQHTSAYVSIRQQSWKLAFGCAALEAVAFGSEYL